MSQLMFIGKSGREAIGGSISDITINGQSYRFHSFTTSDTFSIVSGEFTDLEYLIVAGGGGSGGVGTTNLAVSGAGAGGLIHNFGSPISKDIGIYPIVVGAGGSGTGVIGSNSSLFSIVAIGGGAGSVNGVDRNGGSGAGSPRDNISPGTGISGQGYAGGQGKGIVQPGENKSAAPGGGAGGPGQDNPNDTSVGAPGPGLDLSMYVGTTFGNNGWFASGGRGARKNHLNQWYAGTSATNRGPGSGGDSIQDGDSPGLDGIVIIRYKI